MNLSHLFFQPYIYWLLGYVLTAAGFWCAERYVVRRLLPDDPLVLQPDSHAPNDSEISHALTETQAGNDWLSSRKPTAKLRPVEFAYLIRNGDLSHALAVLAIDLTHRTVKSHINDASADSAEHANRVELNVGAQTEKVPEFALLSEIPLLPADVSSDSSPVVSAATAPMAAEPASDYDLDPVPAYEADMWTLAKEHVRNWTSEKKDSLMLESFKNNPVAYINRVSRIYKFFSETFKSFIVQITKDPRQIRRYFSMAGTMRLLADFSSAGYQQLFELHLKEDLVNRGLLVSEGHRQHSARILFGIAAIGVIVCVVVFLLLAGVTAESIALLTATVLATLGARLLYGLKDWLPYLGDIVQILRSLHRRSWRIFLLRFVSRYIRILIATTCIVVYTVPILLAVLLLKVFGIHGYWHLIFLCLLSSFFLLSVINVGLRGLQVLNEQYPTTRGLELIQETRRRISKLSPLEAFVQMLQTKTYDPTFSQLVALYGIETLLFLA